MNPPTMTPETRARILELNVAGWLGKDIAAELGISPSSVSRVLRDNPPNDGPQEWKEQAPCDWRTLPWMDPFNATRGQLAEMLHICDTCPVLTECEQDLERTRDRVGVRAGVVWSYAEYPSRAKPVPVLTCDCGDLFVRRSNQYGDPTHCSDLCRRRGAA